jgi:hypothetical protein
LPRKVSKRLVHIGVADAVRAHLRQHLTWSRLRRTDIFDLPGTAYGGHDCGICSMCDSMQCLYEQCTILDARWW